VGDDGALRERTSIPTCDDPYGLAESPDRTLLVTCAAAHALQGFVEPAFSRRFTVDLPREPRSILVSSRYRRAYVAHLTAPLLSVVDLAAPERGFATFGTIASPLTTSKGLLVPDPVQGYALASYGAMVVAPHARAVTGDATVRTQSKYGSEGEVASLPAEHGMTAVAIESPSPRVVFGPELDCILPRAATFTASGVLLVACADSDSVHAITGPLSRPGTAETLDRSDLGGWNVWGVAGLFQGASPTVWQVGEGITGVAYDPDTGRAVAWAQIDRTLGVFTAELQRPDNPSLVGIARTRALPDDAAQVALGRRLFHTSGDLRISFDGRACASCHPEGLDDGLVWPTPDGPRQTPTLRDRLEGTAPYGWLGRRETLRDHLAQTIRRLGGAGLEQVETDALIAYLGSMQSPAVRAGTHAVALGRGQAIFDDACGGCHQPASRFTDGERHDVRSRVKGDIAARFDTPSLRRVEQTAPYFHDGRYDTLADLLAGTEGTMWSAPSGGLAPGDRDALLAYVRTL
jgi:mono/diheme cytochrome c family protein